MKSAHGQVRLRKYAAPILAASMFGATLVGTPAAHAGSQMSMDDTENVILGQYAAMPDMFMWSNDGGSSWQKGTERDKFLGTQTIIVADIDMMWVTSSEWDRTATYPTAGTVVRHKGKFWVSRYWAAPGEEPGGNEVWEDHGVAGSPVPIEVFEFHAFTGAAAEQIQREGRAASLAMKKVAGYFPEWGIYEAHDHFTPDKIAWDQITHLNYGFGVLRPSGDGMYSVQLHDPAGRSLMREITTAAVDHDVTPMISIGGWTNSNEDGKEADPTVDGPFEKATKTAAGVEHLSQSAVDYMTTHNFKGIDIDWEYPESKTTGKQLTALVTNLRAKLTALGKERDEYYRLSIATSPNHAKVSNLELKLLAPLVDTINVMTYDYHGAFDPITGHNSPLYANKHDSDQKLNIAATMNEYSEGGVPTGQLLVGIPYYGRGWGDVAGTEKIPGLPGLFNSGTSSIQGKWDDPDKGELTGSNPYYVLEAKERDPNYKKYWDPESRVPYLYNKSTGEFLTYDDPASITEKVNFTIDNNYGGVIIWDLSGDTPDHKLGGIVAKVKDASPSTPEPEVDTEPPSKPTGLSAKTVTESAATLTWSASTDNVGVDHYEVYRGGKLVGTVSATEFTDTQLSPNSSYQYTVKAVDAAGNKSDQSQPCTVKTASELQKHPVMSVGSSVNAADVKLSMNKASFADTGRHIVYLNGKYRFEIYKNTAYYSDKRTAGDLVEAVKTIPAKAGDTLTLVAVGGTPGSSSADRETVQTIKLTAADVTATAEQRAGVKGVSVTGKRLTVQLDKAAYSDQNRYIVRVNGKYQFETYAGAHYYSSSKTSTNQVDVYKTISSLKTGDTVTVEIAAGKPGTSSSQRETITTHTIK